MMTFDVSRKTNAVVASSANETTNSSMDEELVKFKPTAEENKRVLVISLFYLAVAVFIGVPVWLRTTATYQAPLPFWEIKSLCSRPIEILIPVNLISFSDSLLSDDLTEVQTHLVGSSDPGLRCGLQQHGMHKLKVECDFHIRSATQSERTTYTRVLSNSSGLSEFLDVLTSELFNDCSSNVQLTEKSAGSYEHSCSADSSVYTLIILPQKLHTFFKDSGVALNVVQRSARYNLGYVLESSSLTTPENKLKLTSQIATLMNSVLLPLTELEHLTAPATPASEAGPRELTYSKMPFSVDSSTTRQLPPSTDYDITVTILTHSGDAPVEFSQNTESVPPEWSYQLLQDPTPWLQSHVEEVFTSWLPHVRFHFSSQRLHAVDIEQLGQSRLSEDHSYRYYTTDDLSTVVNQLESFLGAPQTASAATRDMAGTKPGLHLILLLAMPLRPVLKNESSDSNCPLPLKFRLPARSGESTPTDVAVVPQWGGLFSIGAPEPCTKSDQSATLVERQLVAVIRTLLGLAEPTQAVARFNPIAPSLDRLGKVDHWELDGWFIRRTVESLLAIRMTMTALVDLLSRFPNMVINDYVASEVTRSTNVWAQTLNDLRGGRHLSNVTGFGGIFSRAQDSLSSVNSAFFDHTLLGRLYFQEDQKFGIYVPLFVPVGVGLLLSTKNALRILFPKEPAT